MKAVKFFGWAAALACGVALPQAPQAAMAPATPLRLCADPANLPFSSNSAGSEPGLYVEIGQAVAQALGRPLETVWSLSIFGKRNLRTTLLAGQCDLAVGLPAVADFMGPRVIFTRPILQLGYVLVLPRDSAATGIEGLKGQRVAVQFGSPPQGLLAARNDVTVVTAMDPEEAMRRLAAGEADAAFLWGPSAGWINHGQLNDRYRLLPVDAPQMQFAAAIGLSSKQPALRDEVDAVLAALAPRIRELQAKYAVGPALAATAPVAGAEPAVQLAQADGGKVDAGLGKEIFNGTCAHCHGPNAVVEDRKINLRRLHVKYGEAMEDTFFTTVTNGRPAKGMPAWKEVFKQQDFANILAWLKTVQDK